MSRHALPFSFVALLLVSLLLSGCGHAPSAVSTGQGSSPAPVPSPGRVGDAPLSIPAAPSPLLSPGHDWITETIDCQGQLNPPSLALDGTGRPHIAYSESLQGDLKYAWSDGAGWRLETVDSTGDLGGGSLALGVDGRPYISYALLPPDFGEYGELRYAWFDGATWMTRTLAGGKDVGWPSSLALDAAGWPHISYHSGEVMGLVYGYWDGTHWITETVDTGHTLGWGSSLALDAAGNPHIAYYGYAALKYAYRTGGSWHIETLAGAGRGSSSVSLAIDSAGRPHIGYDDVDYAGSAIRYAYWDGAQWQIETVDSTTQVGTLVDSCSLALDGQDRPHLSYARAISLWTEHMFQYAYHDEAGWHIEAALEHEVPASFLALDSTDRPRISFFNYDSSCLEYTYQSCTPLDALQIQGPALLPRGVTGVYSATYTPYSGTLPFWEWSNGAVSATAAYSWTAEGAFPLTLTARNDCSQVTDTLTVTVYCQPVEGVQIDGPLTLTVSETGTFRSAVQPVTASLPLTLTWDAGAMGPTAAYSWTVAGVYTVNVMATNVCGGAKNGSLSVEVREPPLRQIYLPQILRE